MRVSRLAGNPIIGPHMDERMGANVNGPSAIRVPDWVSEPLGSWYLYFAHHRDSYIRLAYADDLAGPWRTHRNGVLDLAATPFHDHIASPDVHVDHDTRRVRMYFHGPERGQRSQMTRVALSEDGLRFEVLPDLCGLAYFRAWRTGDGAWHALAMPGVFYRSADGLTGWERTQRLFDDSMRHSAVRLDGTTLHVLYTNVGDVPERILHTTIDTSQRTWTAAPATVLLEPEQDWEGANLPPEPSVRGAIHEPVRQLRDPALLDDDGTWYLLYSVAGESGIAIARLDW